MLGVSVSPNRMCCNAKTSVFVMKHFRVRYETYRCSSKGQTTDSWPHWLIVYHMTQSGPVKKIEWSRTLRFWLSGTVLSSLSEPTGCLIFVFFVAKIALVAFIAETDVV